jgi:3-methyladenine DNA glycosylase/8-oxoguanine DNA glycosylase
MATNGSIAEIHHKARRHLVRRDNVLKTIICEVGACTLVPNPDHFGLLVRSIISQQISTKAAIAIGGRLKASMGRRGITPRAILDAPEATLRAAGLSANKMLALRDLADKVDTKLVPLKKLPAMDDEAIIERLVEVRGIGRWTAQMFLIFSLGRPDVLPVDDYGLRAAAQKHYKLKELPKRDVLAELGAPWQPYRSVATWYMWRSLGGVPQSK